MVKGQKPCGCSKSPRWTKEQYLILARRVAQGRFIVHGFAEKFRGQRTKLSLECLIDGYKWTASIDNIINAYHGCHKCSGKYKPTEQETLDKCKSICEIEGYEPLGFVDGYRNQKSRFEYKCPIHGKQSVVYHAFVSIGSRCGSCWKGRQKELGNGYGYYPERKDEKDFLYVLNFNDRFLKVGRSFDIDERIKNLRTGSKVPIKNIHKLKIFTATHQEIYDTEQEIHKELRERGFQYYLDWTNECFDNECIGILNKLLDIYNLEEICIN